MLNFSAIKAGALKLLGLCKKLIAVTGPFAVIRNVLSIGALVFTVVKLVKKLIEKIKSHKQKKLPETATEYALADSKTREAAPEMKSKYEASIEKTANKLVGKSKKKKKLHSKDKSLKEMLNALDEIRGHKYSKVENCRGKSVSELLDTDPALHAWAFGTPVNKVCHA